MTKFSLWTAGILNILSQMMMTTVMLLLAFRIDQKLALIIVGCYLTQYITTKIMISNVQTIIKDKIKE